MIMTYYLTATFRRFSFDEIANCASIDSCIRINSASDTTHTRIFDGQI
jgi:hypothetical protein